MTEKIKVGDRVFHRMLGEYGVVTEPGLTYSGDSFTQVVLFDDGETKEVSTHFLQRV